MSLGIPSGNYPSEIWPEIMNFIEEGHYAKCIDFVYSHPPEKVKAPFFLLIDIHGFSRFCARCGKKGSEMKEVSQFLRAFFLAMSEFIHNGGGNCIKFIGDAILAIHPKKSPLIKLGKELITFYRKNFQKKYSGTDVVVMVTHPRECLKGFVGSQDYFDYSYWAPGLNYLFSQTKKLPEGYVYYIKRNGKATRYDLQVL